MRVDTTPFSVPETYQIRINVSPLIRIEESGILAGVCYRHRVLSRVAEASVESRGGRQVLVHSPHCMDILFHCYIFRVRTVPLTCYARETNFNYDTMLLMQE